MCCIKSNNNKQTKRERKKEEEKVHSGAFCFQVHKFICESWAVKVQCVYHENTAETESFAAIYRMREADVNVTHTFKSWRKHVCQSRYDRGSVAMIMGHWKTDQNVICNGTLTWAEKNNERNRTLLLHLKILTTTLNQNICCEFVTWQIQNSYVFNCCVLLEETVRILSCQTKQKIMTICV